jgi:hypothetical protein
VAIIRFTITDAGGTASFVGPGHAIKMLVAGCSRGPSTLRELLDMARCYDDRFVSDVMNGLSVFDEHNVRGNTAAIDQQLCEQPPAAWPPFRVYGEATRNASTYPGRAGLILINLGAKRIVQVTNAYAEIQRRDRGRVRSAGTPTNMLYHYDLPPEWVIVP